MVQELWGKVWCFLQKLNIYVLGDPCIPLLAIWSREMEARVHTEVCTEIFTAALSVIAQTWKQPNVHH